MRPVLFIFFLSLTVTFAVVYTIHWYITKADRVLPPEGTYIRQSQHEFGNEWDTLSISPQKSVAAEYLITRQWHYERLLDGEAVQPEYKISISSAFWNAKENTLEELDGSVYTVDPTGKQLFNGKIIYLKIK